MPTISKGTSAVYAKVARQSRLDLPGIPQHVVERGSNRLPCFLDDEDRCRYVTLLREALLATGRALDAYLLIDNHVHLLVTPLAEGDVGRPMRKVDRQYVGQFNASHRSTGTVWQGRYKACLVDQVIYLLRCHSYIDLNSVRARITDDATQFRWSSAAVHSGLCSDVSLTPHTSYLNLGNDAICRGDAYPALLREKISENNLNAIRGYLKQQRALGRDDFWAMVEAKTIRFFWRPSCSLAVQT